MAKAPLYPTPRLTERCLDLLFPPSCVSCRKVGRWICDRCWETIAWETGRTCEMCGLPSVERLCPFCDRGSSALDGITAVARFEDTSREAVHALKYSGHHAISSLMGRLMAEAARTIDATMVVPIPLHWTRRRERGYDQAAMLSRHVGRVLELPMERRALRRVRKTRQQATLDNEARQANVAGAFQSGEIVEGESILLVDDVFTTGATMEAAAGALRDAGAYRVIGLVFAWARPGAPADDPKLPF